MKVQEMEHEWRIDAWSVLDGLAFATVWSARDGQPLVTVMLSPPDWHPVTVANRATALRATRGQFQEGFFDEKGDEIVFSSLEEVTELVRRAFLGGGLGLLPPGEIGGPREPRGISPESFDLGSWEEVQERLSTIETMEDRKSFEAAASRLWRGHRCEGLRNEIRRFLDSMLDELGYGARSRTALADRAAFMTLVSTLSQPGHWHPDIEWYLRHFGYVPHVYGSGVARSMLDGLIFRIPLPGEWRTDRRLQSLGDQLCLALASRRYLETIDSPAKYLPLFICALCVAEAGSPMFFLEEGRDTLLDDQVPAASHWLAYNLPGTLSRDHPGAVQLERFLDRSWRR